MTEPLLQNMSFKQRKPLWESKIWPIGRLLAQHRRPGFHPQSTLTTHDLSSRKVELREDQKFKFILSFRVRGKSGLLLALVST